MKALFARSQKLRTAFALCLVACSAAASEGSQDSLEPVLNAGDKVLRFDWPMVRIGTAEYEQGPTGVTVFSFGRKILAAVDVRGGGPGTVNTDLLRLGYSMPEIDAVVFAGGSAYGLEATTAVASAMKEDGRTSGDWLNLGLTVGAIVYDLGARRLNEIVPDKRLAQAAYRASRSGEFALGAHGAGRNVRSGGYFGCNAHSGQGGAFRQIGALKIAVFAVVNPLGAVVDRDGNVVACYPDSNWPKPLRAQQLLAGLPDSRQPGWSPPTNQGEKRNTTISLVVTNVKLEPSRLQRLAVQVHTSMARALQPFSTESDGDVLYAVSTAEIEEQAAAISAMDLGVIASELMWDAILTSVPEQPAVMKATRPVHVDARALERFAGDYVFGKFVTVRLSVEGGKLMARVTGERNAYAIGRDQAVELQPLSASEFTIPGRYPLVVKLDQGGNLVFNPGHWQQTGVRVAR